MERDSLVKGIGRLIGTAAEIGVTLAGAVDKATADGRELPPPPPGETPTAAIIRHSFSAAGNLVRHVVDAAQQTRGTAQPGGAGRGDAARGPTAPQARQGSTLRVPLSIENPGREPLRALAPAIAGWTSANGAQGAPGTVRFLPELLDIEPRDFEKLTVFVDVAADAAPGLYRLEIALGENASVAIDFTVVTDDAPSA